MTESALSHPAHIRVVAPLLAVLLMLPPVADYWNQSYYLGFVSRIMIFAMAATSLNLILGLGGMVSFGHAAFFGLGGYAVGILMYYGITTAWISWPVAVLTSAVAALIIGSISLRTRGVYFIMITLAFAQMLYYVFISLQIYGSDDGLPLSGRSTLEGGPDLTSDTAFFYVVLALSVATLSGLQRLSVSRFGRVVQAIRDNENRAEAIGYPAFRYKLVAFVIAGGLAGLAGALLANQNGIVSPEMMYWTQSGSLMVMVILGGTGYLYGGAIGASLLLLVEEVLSDLTDHWQLPLGILLLVIVLFAPSGIAGLAGRRVRHG